MRFETVTLLGALVAFARFPEGSCDGSLGYESEILMKRNEEASWLLKHAEEENYKLENVIEILSRRAEGLELTKGLGKVDMTQVPKSSKTQGVHEGVIYSVALGANDNGNLIKVSVNEFDKNGKKVPIEKRNEIKRKLEARLTGNSFD